MPRPVAVGIRVTGLRTMARDARRTITRMDKGIRGANKRSVERVLVPRIRSAAPRRKGWLAGSVRARATAQRAQIIVGTPVKVPYAGPINFGWPLRHIAAQEFIYSSIAAVEEEMLDVYIFEIDKATRPFAPLGKL